MNYIPEPSIETSPDTSVADPAPYDVSVETSDENTTLRPSDFFLYLLVGALFGIVLTKSEAISWFRIQEMFRFQSFHMYGIIALAIAVAAASIVVIKRFKLRNIRGETIAIKPKEFDRGYSQIIGGTLFGAGWALLGACPGPLYALIGTGATVMIVTLFAAITGAWIYGALRPVLPH